jgi:hypothetical protein
VAQSATTISFGVKFSGFTEFGDDTGSLVLNLAHR